MTSPINFPPNYPQIVDGFCYSGVFTSRPLLSRPHPVSWEWASLTAPTFQLLRLAADSYRPRQWVVPKNFFDLNNPNNANIKPGQTVFYEFEVKEGSWLWGLEFSTFEADVDFEGSQLENARFSVMIRQGSDLPFFDRPTAASAISCSPPTSLLPEPRLIIPPCQLHVEISNDSDPADEENAVSCQLLMLFAEPK